MQQYLGMGLAALLAVTPSAARAGVESTSAAAEQPGAVALHYRASAQRIDYHPLFAQIDRVRMFTRDAQGAGLEVINPHVPLEYIFSYVQSQLPDAAGVGAVVRGELERQNQTRVAAYNVVFGQWETTLRAVYRNQRGCEVTPVKDAQGRLVFQQPRGPYLDPLNMPDFRSALEDVFAQRSLPLVQRSGEMDFFYGEEEIAREVLTELLRPVAERIKTRGDIGVSLIGTEDDEVSVNIAEELFGSAIVRETLDGKLNFESQRRQFLESICDQAHDYVEGRFVDMIYITPITADDTTANLRSLADPRIPVRVLVTAFGSEIPYKELKRNLPGSVILNIDEQHSPLILDKQLADEGYGDAERYDRTAADTFARKRMLLNPDARLMGIDYPWNLHSTTTPFVHTAVSNERLGPHRLVFRTPHTHPLIIAGSYKDVRDAQREFLEFWFDEGQ